MTEAKEHAASQVLDERRKMDAERLSHDEKMQEQLFDLGADPREEHDLAKDPAAEERIRPWRERLIRELAGRPEGFVKEGKLARLEGPTPYCRSEELMAAGKNLADADHGSTSLG